MHSETTYLIYNTMRTKPYAYSSFSPKLLFAKPFFFFYSECVNCDNTLKLVNILCSGLSQ